MNKLALTGQTEAPASPLTPVLYAFLLLYASIVAVLAGTGSEKFEHLHLVIDTANGMLSLLLAMFLLAEQHRIPSRIRKILAIGFGFAAATEILHALVGIEWSGWMAWMEAYSHTLRPATWPPSAYVLPTALLWTSWLIKRNSALRPGQFAAGMTVVTLVLYAVSLSLPKYVDTGILGIQRPTQLPLLFLLASVIVAFWRQRHAHPLFHGIALMCGLLFLSDLCMLYSTSPHEKFTMMAHFGKMLAYGLLHTIQMRVAADDSRARSTAESALFLEKERLRAALDELNHQKFALDQHAIVGTTDAEGTITYANQRFSDISGYTAGELIGTNYRLIGSGTHQREFFSDLYRTITAGKVWHGDICNRAKDGHRFWLSTTIVPLLNDQGQPTQYIAIHTDISGIKNAEAEINQLNAVLEDRVRDRTAALEASNQSLQLAKFQADAANIAKSAFLANMSHEIRTPMNGIIGMAHILRMEGVSPRQEERLDKIDTAAEHLLAIINDVLDISKIEAGKLVLDEAPVAIDSLLSNVVTILSGRAKAKDVRLLIEASALPQRLFGDPMRLQQALLNYAGNAVKFTNAGTVTLRARKLTETENSLLIRFEVEDTGIGIAPAAMPRLFRAFEQVDNSMTRKYGGTGLGLNITKRLAELMGGDVGAESTPGAGSTFWFTARMRKNGTAPDVARDTGEYAESAETAEDLIMQRYQGSTILVVDDEPINREIAQTLLESAGLLVDIAEDGEAALALAKHRTYTAIFMDMQMPKLNGLDATRQIRELTGFRDTPILAMTANVFPEDKARCLAAGMNDVLIKPFTRQSLFATLLHGLQRDQRQV